VARKDFRVVRDKFAKDDALPFGRLLRRDYVLSVLEDEGHKYRQGVFCPLVTLWGWLSQCLSQDKSLNEAVTRILVNRVATGLPACSASSASYSNARQRFPLSVMTRLAKEIGRNVHNSASDAWHWRGREVFLVDGTGLSMPDTQELQEVYPQLTTQAPGIGFPMMRAVAMISLSTGAVIDFAFDKTSGKGTGEGNLFRAMLDRVNRDDIIVADRLYPSFRSIAALQLRGADMVSVSHHARKIDFTKGVQLGENDHIVEWHQERQLNRRVPSEELDSLPKSVFVREFLIDVDGRDGGKEQAIVVTTITDPTVPQQEISDLYWRRWNCELDLRSIKQSMHLDVLRCKTPEMVAKEIFCHILAYNLLRGVMTASAKRTGVMPRQLSVKGAMQAVESFTPAMMATNAGEVLYDAFLTTVSAHRVGNRPGRLEPRFKKRRPAWGEYMTIPRSKSHRRLASQANSLR
jgi:hypothetical protein